MRFCSLAPFILFFAGGLLAGSQQHADPTSSASKPRWFLTWSDEFDGPAGSTPDPAKWVVESGEMAGATMSWNTTQPAAKTFARKTGT